MAVEVVRQAIEAEDVVIALKENAGLDQPGHPPVSVPERVDRDEEEVREQRTHHGVVRHERSGIHERHEPIDEPGHVLRRGSAMHAAQRCRPHDDGMRPQATRRVVRLVGPLRDQRVQLQDVGMPKWGAGGRESLPDPVLRQAGVLHLPLVPGGNGRRRRRGRQEVHLPVHLGLGQWIALEGGRSVHGAHTVQLVQLRLPVGRQHQIECRFLGCLDSDQARSQGVQAEPVLEAEPLPVHDVYCDTLSDTTLFNTVTCCK